MEEVMAGIDEAEERQAISKSMVKGKIKSLKKTTKV